MEPCLLCIEEVFCTLLLRVFLRVLLYTMPPYKYKSIFFMAMGDHNVEIFFRDTFTPALHHASP